LTAVAVSRIDDRDVTRYWWLQLITGGAWLLLSVIVFRFDFSTVSAISILFGVVMLAAGITEVVNVFSAAGWWRIAHALLALAFVVIGIVSFVHPGDTFKALAGVMSFYFVFKGGFDLVLAIAARDVLDLWWLRLALGIVEVLLGFWAAGYFGRSVTLLVVWVGATALTRGIGDLFAAFAVRAARPA
jgi:uncharacterized membrane protein HdeD (DUF308 family)